MDSATQFDSSQALPGNENLQLDPDKLVYKTMPQGINTPVKPLMPLDQSPLAVPAVKTDSKSQPAQQQVVTSINASIQAKSSSTRQIIIVICLAVLVIAAILFGYFRFIKKPALNKSIITNSSQQSSANNGAATPTGVTPDTSLSDNSSSVNPPADNALPTAAVLPASWLTKYFGSLTCANQAVCGPNADPDHDGLTNIEAYNLGTDPNNPDTDGDGIADGDEVHVFNTDPLSAHTAGVAKFSDSGDLIYKYNSKAHRPFNDSDLCQIAAKIKQYGLHSPTIKTLPPNIIDFYTNYSSSTCAAPTSSGTSTNPSTALARDTQRSDTINQISFALLKYQSVNQNYPDTTDFNNMLNLIKPFLTSRAINTTDPTNTPPYVYTYTSIKDTAGNSTDFKLSYFSETQGQIITINAAAAQKAMSLDQLNQRDTIREDNLNQISTALQSYSNDNVDPANPNSKVFPAQATWKQSLSPKYLATVPTDPKTQGDYVYSVSADSSSYTLTATLENPASGKTSYVCTQDNCSFN